MFITPEQKNKLLDHLLDWHESRHGKQYYSLHPAPVKPIQLISVPKKSGVNHNSVQINFWFYSIRRLKNLKTQEEVYLYKIFRQLYLKFHPVCEYCNCAPAIIIHHTLGRKHFYLDILTFRASCQPCEDKQHGRVKPDKKLVLQIIP